MSSVRERAERALDEKVRPFIQAHGGNVSIVSYDDGLMEVDFHGACGACDVRPVTFAATVRRVLLEIDEIDQVRCSAVPLSEKKLDSIAAFFAKPDR